MSDFGCYSGEKFLSLELPPREWLVEGLIRKSDSVILVGNEKSGKSLFILQLICALTSGQPFLDTYNVGRPINVSYFQLEGELTDSQDRLKRMIETLEINPSLLNFYFYPPLELQNRAYAQGLCNKIKENGTPDLLIIDPIYFAFMGSLSDDDIVRNFIGNVRIIKDTLKCAVILVHHTHKQRWSTDGFQIDEGDDASFGSKFLKAWADHVILFHYDSKKALRTMSCSTQRSGDIIKQCQLRLIEPSPLYFEPFDKNPTSEMLIMNLLFQEQFKDGLTGNDISKRLDINRNTFFSSIKKLLVEDIVKKSSTRPIVYWYNREKLK